MVSSRIFRFALALFLTQAVIVFAQEDAAEAPDKHSGGKNSAVDDPVHAGDPVHTVEFKTKFEHPDGTITSKVLKMLHTEKPVSSGALNPLAGYIFSALIFAGGILFYMHANRCFHPRESRGNDFVIEQLAQQTSSYRRRP